MGEERVKVVIADDEPIIRINIGEILAQNGFDVCARVSNGYEAIKACQKFQPEVALLDIKMPICDGVSAAKSIYMAKTAETIIMITAYSDIALVKRLSMRGSTGIWSSLSMERHCSQAFAWQGHRAGKCGACGRIWKKQGRIWKHESSWNVRKES